MRVASPDLFAPPIVMTSDGFRFYARRQAEELGIDATVVLEPMRRDSGPAIAAGTALARRRDPMPSSSRLRPITSFSFRSGPCTGWPIRAASGSN